MPIKLQRTKNKLPTLLSSQLILLGILVHNLLGVSLHLLAIHRLYSSLTILVSVVYCMHVFIVMYYVIQVNGELVSTLMFREYLNAFLCTRCFPTTSTIRKCSCPTTSAT